MKSSTKKKAAKKAPVKTGKTVKKAAKAAPKKAAKKEVVINHNKHFPIVNKSRTEITELLNSTNGKFFTSTHIDKQGNPRTMNAIKSSKSQPTALGYITVWSVRDKDYRTIDPRTITDLSFSGIHYQVK